MSSLNLPLTLSLCGFACLTGTQKGFKEKVVERTGRLARLHSYHSFTMELLCHSFLVTEPSLLEMAHTSIDGLLSIPCTALFCDTSFSPNSCEGTYATTVSHPQDSCELQRRCDLSHVRKKRIDCCYCNCTEENESMERGATSTSSRIRCHQLLLKPSSRGEFSMLLSPSQRNSRCR